MTVVLWIAAFCASLLACDRVAKSPWLLKLLAGFAYGFCLCLLFASISGLVSVMVDGGFGWFSTIHLVEMLHAGVLGGLVSALLTLLFTRFFKR